MHTGTYKGFAMHNTQLAQHIQAHCDEVVQQSTQYGKELWSQFVTLHPADKAYVLSQCADTNGVQLFHGLEPDDQLHVFTQLSDARKVAYLSELEEHERRNILSNMSIDDLTDFFDELSDDTLEQYLRLLHKKSRKKVLSLLKFTPETAGAVMTTNVITLLGSFSVQKAIEILQRLQPDRKLHHIMYVTNQDNKLIGHIYIEDLVLHAPDKRIRHIVHDNKLIARSDKDQEEVARKMRHYHVTNIPVVDDDDHFLGVISPNTLAEILEHESSEDIYRMATMNPVHTGYFETPIARLVYQRSWILVVLLLAQSITSMIMYQYEQTLTAFLYIFTTMLASAGGNTSSQTSALVIQGLASGEINENNKARFFGREFWIASCIAAIMMSVGFARAYLTHGSDVWASLAVSASLGGIVMTSVVLGGFIPLILNRLNLDPAYSAGPLLATLMDIIGMYLFCLISSAILGV